MDAFDISPSGRRAVISARGQILTIATDRGDITRVAPDNMASRNQFPKWSADGKYIAYMSDKSGRDEIWISDPEGSSPKKITDLDNEKGALVWTPDSKSLLYTAADKKLYSYSVADGKTAVVTSSDVNRIGSVAVSPDSKWVAFAKQDRTLRSHVYIAPIGGGEERHVSDDGLLYSETNAVWTADGRYLVFTSAEGIQQRHRDPGRHRHDDGPVGAVAAGSGSRSDEPRHRQRGAGPGGRSGGAAERRPWRRRRARRARMPRLPTCASTGTASRAGRGGSRCPAPRSAG